MSAESLSEREQQFLDHLRKAQELEVSLAEYARSFELDAKELYHAKRTLVRKGVIPARNVGESPRPEPAQLADFVPVQVVAPRSAAGRSTPVCRIHHPSGLVIECSSFPPDSWLSMLLSGARDVPA